MDTSDKKYETKFSEQIARKEKRKLKAQRVNSGTVWAGLGMFGMVGWSVAIPTLLGTALGIWLDQHHPGKHAWTLALLVAGLAIGCFNAWHWVTKEDREMQDEQGGDDE